MACAPMNWREVERTLREYFDAAGVEVSQVSGEQMIHVGNMPDCRNPEACRARLPLYCECAGEPPRVLSGPVLLNLSDLARRLAE